MLVAFVLYQKSGKLLIRRFIQIELNSNRTIMDILGFLLAYAIKIPLIPFHLANKCVSKAPTVGTMLYLVLLKMDCTGCWYCWRHWQQRVHVYFHRTWNCRCDLRSIVALKQKILKKLLAYSSLAHVGLIAAGTYTLTLDGLREQFYK
jgi:NADH-quinone oxidoreductase subunit M